MIDLTPEELVKKQISAAFDSVHLIEKLNLLETLTEEQVDSKKRNVEHLNIMLGREDFATALTEEQRTQINLASGK